MASVRTAAVAGMFYPGDARALATELDELLGGVEQAEARLGFPKALIVPHDLAWQAAAFVLFRAFDIGKPPPIDWFERRYHGGFGVMFDDLLAAGYSLLSLALIKRLLG